MSKKPASNKKKSRQQAYTLLIISTICWGAALVITKPAFEFTTPFRFLLYRYFLASGLFSLIYLWLNRQKLKTKQIFTIIALESLGTVFNLAILYLGLAKTTAIEASLIGTTGPIFITLAGIAFLKEKQENHEWAGLIFSFLGMILIVTTNHSQTQQISMVGNLLIVSYNLLNAVYLILAKKFYKNIDKNLVGAVSFILGLIAFLAISWFEAGSSWQNLNQLIAQDWQQMSVVLPALYMAIFGSIIGLIAYIKGQDKIEASEASLFSYLQPLIYLPLGVLLLKENVSPQQLIGLGFIIIGVITAEKRSTRKTV